MPSLGRIYHDVGVLVEVDACADGDGLDLLDVELPGAVQDDLERVADAAPSPVIGAGQTPRQRQLKRVPATAHCTI